MLRASPSIPKPLALKIERLARRAHAFHRYAHHPLCERYQGEVLRIGKRTRVCRGCACAFGGGVLGLVLGGLTQMPVSVLVLVAVVGAAAAGATLWPARAVAEEPRKRTSKLVTRALPVGLAGLVFGAALAQRTPAVLALAAGTAALFALLTLRYQKRGPERSPCTTCPERTLSPCSGLREIVRAERAFSRRSGRLLAPLYASSENGVKLVSRS